MLRRTVEVHIPQATVKLFYDDESSHWYCVARIGAQLVEVDVPAQVYETRRRDRWVARKHVHVRPEDVSIRSWDGGDVEDFIQHNEQFWMGL